MSTIIILLTTALIILSAADACFIVLITVATKRLPLYFTAFLTMPAGQLFMLYSYGFETWTPYWLAGVGLSLLADLLLLIFTISLEKKTVAEEQLKDAKHRAKLEKAHYEAVQNRSEQLAEIRRELSDKLETVTELVKTGKEETAREIIADFAEKIDRTQPNPYCSIPVVNAVLTEKEKECEAASIGLTVELSIPEPLAVSPMHLCSIFSNILDNAITASQKTKETDKPVIRLSSLIDGDYLFIKTTNPSDEPNNKPPPGRGYGLRILTELAKRYGGKFHTDYQDGTFTAIVSLLATGPAPER